jgi:hypothetical protein
MADRFEAAENSFLGKTKQKVAKGQLKRALEAITLRDSVEFFGKLLDDDTEQLIWRMFIFGKAPFVEEFTDEHGDKVERTVIKDIEPNPTSLKAFLRAVEYKRGAPVTLPSGRREDEGQSKSIEINIIGATPEYFEKAAKTKGLLTGKG